MVAGCAAAAGGPRILMPAKGLAAAVALGAPAVGVEGGAPLPRLAFSIFLVFRTSSEAVSGMPLSSSWTTQPLVRNSGRDKDAYKDAHQKLFIAR